MAEAIVIRNFGGSDVLKLEAVAIGDPGPGEVHVRQTAIGVNFHDIYVRSGLYDTLQPPGIPGCEAIGVVERAGPDVEFEHGDRVAYVTAGYGGYASERILAADLALRVPEAIGDEVVAANLLRALTVEMLTRRSHRLEPGMTILVHAAAGGVGRLLCQMASRLGVTVIGTVGSESKAAIATAAGCDHTILYREVDVADAVHDLTGGRGVQVVYDSIGADTFSGSLSALAPLGHLVNFGQASGAVEPLSMSTLAAKSLTVSRPILFHYLNVAGQYQAMADVAFEWFADGVLRPTPVKSFPLADAAAAHDLLESRAAGDNSVILIV